VTIIFVRVKEQITRLSKRNMTSFEAQGTVRADKQLGLGNWTSEVASRIKRGGTIVEAGVRRRKALVESKEIVSGKWVRINSGEGREPNEFQVEEVRSDYRVIIRRKGRHGTRLLDPSELDVIEKPADAE